jgi:hypothetical protein
MVRDRHWIDCLRSLPDQLFEIVAGSIVVDRKKVWQERMWTYGGLMMTAFGFWDVPCFLL